MVFLKFIYNSVNMKPSGCTEDSKEEQEKLRDYQLLVEYTSLKVYAPLGVYVLPQIGNMRVWHGVIFIRQGLYKGGVFRFKIDIPYDYPNVAPTVFFHTYVYHSLIHPETGELAFGPQFPEWRPGKDFIFCVLGYIKKIFYFKDFWTVAKYVLNNQALYTFTQDERLYAEDARRCVLASENYENENSVSNPIRFLRFNAFHQKVLEVFKKSAESASNSEECFMRWFRQTFSQI